MSGRNSYFDTRLRIVNRLEKEGRKFISGNRCRRIKYSLREQVRPGRRESHLVGGDVTNRDDVTTTTSAL